MYLVIDFAEYEVDFQPTQTIASMNYFLTIETAQEHINQTIENSIYNLSQYDDSDDEEGSDDLTTHTLMLFEVNERFGLTFDPMTAQYSLKDNPIVSFDYQSNDF
jgi:hypothetical protein